MKAEIDSIEPDIAQFAYRRLKRRLHDLAISPSAGSTHFYEDLHSHSYSSSPTAFVPFLRERSSIGKLLTAEPFSPPTAGSLGKCRSRSVQRRGVMKTHAARLKKQPLKCGTPGVGSYGVKYPWETRPIYAPRKQYFSPTSASPGKSKVSHPSFPAVSSPFLPVYSATPKQHRFKPPNHDKFDALRPEVVLKSVKKTNFQSVKLQDSPQDLAESLQLSERRRLKNAKLFVVKRFMRRMLKGKFY